MLEVILVQGFCPLKKKITQFSNGFRFNLVWINAIFTIRNLKQNTEDF